MPVTILRNARFNIYVQYRQSGVKEKKNRWEAERLHMALPPRSPSRFQLVGPDRIPLGQLLLKLGVMRVVQGPGQIFWVLSRDDRDLKKNKRGGKYEKEPQIPLIESCYPSYTTRIIDMEISKGHVFDTFLSRYCDIQVHSSLISNRIGDSRWVNGAILGKAGTRMVKSFSRVPVPGRLQEPDMNKTAVRDSEGSTWTLHLYISFLPKKEKVS
ncbi:hypothetical protein F4778DRAFT_731189 [Xylariomycetidae sp. FL2044]|nr:hypothetical protein F4778DRAFT_731189 [Xylariomycetidae sp. FL2044]